MSDQPGSASGGQAKGQQTQGATAPPVSEEEARQYLEQLRGAPAEQLLADVLSSLLTGAQAKLGRRDARLLIDSSGLVVDHARPHLPQQFVSQVDNVLAQLRMAQIEAEKKVASEQQDEPNDLASVPAPPAQPGTATPAQQTPPQAPTSKLWVPGR
ncbi:hypothetical protein [Phytoactinopolyspora mesophila]|uniref:Uncharacterized protein n=1 Tax=Phytoactinopolyspora mesophila TaxID=2650750 RepID=A0A7K3LYB2_9ACTN|nr:hypothetical protein [Phytoactinopolyspora mesophila]NDL55999.1 hypothetical protein [Phytoactinopolyspora mesophila]